jgi:hypothetical protein
MHILNKYMLERQKPLSYSEMKHIYLPGGYYVFRGKNVFKATI